MSVRDDEQRSGEKKYIYIPTYNLTDLFFSLYIHVE